MNTMSIKTTTGPASSIRYAVAFRKPMCGSNCFHAPARKQRGVVLFLTLIALLAMSLAAVALIRSVDTNAMISGNIAFKQETTAAADRGMEAAMAWMNDQETKYRALNPNAVTNNVDTDIKHPFNNDNLPAGYYSSLDPSIDLTASTTWAGTSAKSVGTDSSGNTVSYIIQRMCRFPGSLANAADCLNNSVPSNNNCMETPNPNCVALPPGIPTQIRVTIRSVGLNGTVSYVQGFIF